MSGVGRLDKAIEHSPPLAWHLAPAELTQPGNELVPGQYGQAARILDDRHQGPLGVDGQHGDGTVLRVTAQPPGPRQDPAQQFSGRFGLDPEPFHKSLQRVPREPDRAVITLTCGKHLGQTTSLTWHEGSSGVPGGCSRRFIVSHLISMTCVRQTEWPAFRHKALLKSNLRRTIQHQPPGTPEEPIVHQSYLTGCTLPSKTVPQMAMSLSFMGSTVIGSSWRTAKLATLPGAMDPISCSIRHE